MDSELANDRTFLAWLRTGIALFGLGFVIAKVAFIIPADRASVSDEDFYSLVGVLSVLGGGALILVGYLQHVSVAKALVSDATEARKLRWPLTITLFGLAGALALSVLIVVST